MAFTAHSQLRHRTCAFPALSKSSTTVSGALRPAFRGNVLLADLRCAVLSSITCRFRAGAFHAPLQAGCASRLLQQGLTRDWPPCLYPVRTATQFLHYVLTLLRASQVPSTVVEETASPPFSQTHRISCSTQQTQDVSASSALSARLISQLPPCYSYEQMHHSFNRCPIFAQEHVGMPEAELLPNQIYSHCNKPTLLWRHLGSSTRHETL